MLVIRAESMGMCFGVRDALKLVTAVAEPSQVTIFGQLVHNPIVTAALAARGFGELAEADRNQVPERPVVLITAHGISDRTRRQLSEGGKTVIDTTCPLVRRVHRAATELSEAGYHVLVLGQQGHVEVRGIVEDLESYDVVGSVDEVRFYERARIGIVCQTTISPSLAEQICAHVQLHNPLAEIRLIDTICEPTRRRQWAMQSLVEQVEAVVVVGGKNSNNTAQLTAFCHDHGKPVLQVQSAEELDPVWLAAYRKVGLTAGTSTLPETIEQVYRALLAI